MSVIPPVNGTVELGWAHPSGFMAGAALRWAGPQYRLSLDDYKNPNLPKYGTPGYAVVDLRLAYRMGGRIRLNATVENLIDTPYRSHGSAVNAPGRGVLLAIEGSL
jgi:iron complex outermembrane receptor protein/hemoglobin/transferrin/lactoferrin receptor protein